MKTMVYNNGNAINFDLERYNLKLFYDRDSSNKAIRELLSNILEECKRGVHMNEFMTNNVLKIKKY